MTRVIAAGAWLKNRACRVDGEHVTWSALHGDLAAPDACVALQQSLDALLRRGPVDAIAHDLHPDFESTRLAQTAAARCGVPALAVQHHHAHVAAVAAEHGLDRPLIGVALDGVGLGSDGSAWGGELLWVHGARWRRLGHLGTLRLPGGDRAAREPWRMAAAALHAVGRGAQIVPRFAPVVGEALAAGVVTMLERGLNCPATSSAGRWFDAAAGLLGLSVRQEAEAEAAIALEQAATMWLERHAPPTVPRCGLDLAALVHAVADARDRGEGAALFHLGLAQALAEAAIDAAGAQDVGDVALGGGCFHNRLLTARLTAALQAVGLRVHRVREPGDAALALGQAHVAACMLREPQEVVACA